MSREPEYLALIIRNGAKQDEVARCYAALMHDVDLGHPTYWRAANALIMARWPKGLQRVKERAWKYYEGRLS